jgi:subtilisin family serine protease
MTVDPYGTKTSPYGTKTSPFGWMNPYGTKTSPFGIDEYGAPGSGGRQVVAYVGPPPVRRAQLWKKGRRPVVAVLDTGCGDHVWLPDSIVTRYPELDERIIGASGLRTDPERTGDLAGPLDGALDSSSGHGTFIAGIIRQVCPEADIVSVRVADSQGNVLEGAFMLAVRSLVKWMARSRAEGGRQIDVMNLSLGYYHETPEDDLFDRTLSELLLAARRRGCAVVCSAGNDATDRPAFPAALWGWNDPLLTVPDPESVAPHLSVGARNPNGTVALFSNIGPWVTTYAPGASVLSTYPPFNGGMQPDVRDDRLGLPRETIDPDDFTGPSVPGPRPEQGAGFAIWSGTSFAAPYVAAKLAAELAEPLMSGLLTTVPDRVAALRKARRRVSDRLDREGARRD